ncbi:nitroreductase [Aliiroseovarius sp.]|uniref:nitroreductase n=1 Tax=Aliiroseovarius sp. TaxID=1872442 RepID=UPI002616BDEC|nr:nitroreductase [Aliiroseovarius sp.]
MTHDALTELLSARHSCRAYLPDPVPRETIERVLRAAQHVPSWCNAQPWKVHITGKEETTRLADALYSEAMAGTPAPEIPFPTAYTDKHRDRRRACGWQLYDAVGVKKGDRAGSARQMMENFRFFGAPHMALITAPRELGQYAYLDCGGFITGFCLAAKSLGLGTVPQAAIAGFAPFLRDWFDLDADRTILAGIAFGLPDEKHPANAFRTDRADLTEWVAWKG